MSVRPKVTVLCHYFHPDDVVSARHFSHFCLDLAERGWCVEISQLAPAKSWLPGRSRPPTPLREDWRGVAIRRVWRPPLRQAGALGRIGNALWMIAAWSGLAFRERRRAPDVVVIGTDPVLSVLVAVVVRLFRPRIRLVHWCFDLYPEAPIAEGMLAPRGWPTRLLRRLLRKAYGSCDLIADLRRLHVRAAGWKGMATSGKRSPSYPGPLAEPDEAGRPDPSAPQ